MRFPELTRPIWAVASLLLGIVYFLIQFLTDGPWIGIVGLLLLGVPGITIGWSLGSRLPSWPEAILMSLGMSIVLMVLVGIVAALSPGGLDSSSVAAVELVVLLIATILWLKPHPGPYPVPVLPRLRAQPGSVAMVLIGLLLGAAGFSVATEAAEAQTYAGFVQFWSVPPPPGEAGILGIHNVSGVTLECQVAIDRSGQPDLDLQIGNFGDGQSWLSTLPRASLGDTEPWHVSLHCAGSDGATFDRQLTINPPA